LKDRIVNDLIRVDSGSYSREELNPDMVSNKWKFWFLKQYLLNKLQDVNILNFLQGLDPGITVSDVKSVVNGIDSVVNTILGVESSYFNLEHIDDQNPVLPYIQDLISINSLIE
jgi:hypothetical protein